jgi:MoxR-like ATPase
MKRSERTNDWKVSTVDFRIVDRIIENINCVIVGKDRGIEMLLVALLADGHVLLEDVPGVGKTLLAKSLAKSIGGCFSRIQFTPDLLPADITGFNVYNQQAGRFIYQSGPVITNILLADEINRTIPRTQSSLLESMEERQVTVDGQTYFLPRPFFVMATQNPIELEGTFPLPEAQLDRFLLKLRLGYPEKDEEISMLERFREKDPLASLEAVASPEQITELQGAQKKILSGTGIHCGYRKGHPQKQGFAFRGKPKRLSRFDACRSGAGGTSGERLCIAGRYQAPGSAGPRTPTDPDRRGAVAWRNTGAPS